MLQNEYVQDLYVCDVDIHGRIGTGGFSTNSFHAKTGLYLHYVVHYRLKTAQWMSKLSTDSLSYRRTGFSCENLIIANCELF